MPTTNPSPAAPPPESTYRLQFHAGFTFRDAAAIVPYLASLGITHAYASPYLKARAGSTHGYDVIDHNALNPELGTTADYHAWLDAMAAHGMSHVLDTVPNHVGVGTNDNAWWNDVLEHGRASRYATHFDIAWDAAPRPESRGKVLLPLLGSPYGQVLEKGELKLAFEEGAFAVHYYDRHFPIAPSTYARVLGHRIESLATRPDASRAYREIVAAFDALPTDDATARAERAGALKARLAALAASSQPVREFIGVNVRTFNGTPGEPRSFDPLDDLLSRQNFRLAYWRLAPDEINYRRFFDINDLAALSMQHQAVFDAAHALTLRLVAEGKVAGLRIDHPDGLFDPKQYFERLQTAGGKGLWVTVEKILAADEPLPDDWPVAGTSGYEFINWVNGLFVDPAAEAPLTRLYEEWVGDATPFADLVYRKKQLILRISLASELRLLAVQLDALAQRDRHARDFSLEGLRQALGEVIACFGVYRTYASDAGPRQADRPYVDAAVDDAIRRNPETDRAVFDYVRRTLRLEYPAAASDEDRAAQGRFVGRFQQVSAPVMAKGVEDTAFYVYARFVSLNEVGGDPARFGLAPDVLHRALADRQAKWPASLSPLSTHDTKRSEDVRARLNVLSEIPDAWRDAALRWRDLNAPHRARLPDGGAAPSPADEYLIYQTLLGAWPEDFARDRAAFAERIAAYVTKAMREAKVHTSWTSPNAAYEEGTLAFVRAILDPQTAGPFLADLAPLRQTVAHYGRLNALSQTLLRLTAPGVPDTYQGTELWDLSLVDPDNRRPVDYAMRQTLLDGLSSPSVEATSALLASLPDGRAKLFVTRQALLARRQHPGLFSRGDYLPGATAGSRAANLFGFARRLGDASAIVAIPRFLTRVSPHDALPLGQAWGDTRLVLPGVDRQTPFVNLFTGEPVPLAPHGPAAIEAAALFAHFPVALLVAGG